MHAWHLPPASCFLVVIRDFFFLEVCSVAAKISSTADSAILRKENITWYGRRWWFLPVLDSIKVSKLNVIVRPRNKFQAWYILCTTEQNLWCYRYVMRGSARIRPRPEASDNAHIIFPPVYSLLVFLHLRDLTLRQPTHFVNRSKHSLSVR